MGSHHAGRQPGKGRVVTELRLGGEITPDTLAELATRLETAGLAPDGRERAITSLNAAIEEGREVAFATGDAGELFARVDFRELEKWLHAKEIAYVKRVVHKDGAAAEASFRPELGARSFLWTEVSPRTGAPVLRWDALFKAKAERRKALKEQARKVRQHYAGTFPALTMDVCHPQP